MAPAVNYLHPNYCRFRPESHLFLLITFKITNFYFDSFFGCLYFLLYTGPTNVTITSVTVIRQSFQDISC